MVATAAGWGHAAAQTGTPGELPDDAAGIPEHTPEDTAEEIPEETPQEAPELVLEVCVAARRLTDGRVEIAVQPRPEGRSCGERLLPRLRNLPVGAEAGRWLVTSPVTIEGYGLRVAARRLTDGRVEIAVQRRSAEDGPWGPRLRPQHRFLPAVSAAGRWLSSSPVDALAPEGSVLEWAQVVSFYGHPGAPAMGVLGRDDPATVAADIAAWAAHYDRLNGPRDVIPAFHLITGVAHAHPTPDGTWLGRLPAERIAEYVEVARERGMLVFLDNQIGWSDPLTEVRLLEPFLREPFVHMALDPEFATKRRGERPGLVIGSVTAAEVNDVQRYLAALVAEEGIPPKILMVHQFTPYMLRDRAAVADVDGVDLSIDMDGFGRIPVKVAGYDAFSVPEPSERPAFKLFFDYDTPPMTPEQVQALDPPPDLIIYQ
ncbi:MAG: hypothetical protein OXG52_06235 [bacterium]|nr:hypothetical protein [bacterium]